MSDPKRQYARFVAVAGGLLGSFAAVLYGLVVTMQPVTGNLTRLGGYLESEYGWNAPQQIFPQPLFRIGTTIEDYDRPFDVVVVGDSFSHNDSKGWQNYFVDQTGLSLLTFHVARMPLEEILDSPVFRATPPRLFVYQSIERNLIARLGECDHAVPPHTEPPRLVSIELRPLDAPIEDIDRSQVPPYRQATRFDSAINYIRKAILRWLGFDRTEVRRYRLDRANLFSSRASDEMLILTRDDRIRGATDEQVTSVGCNLLAMRDRVQANGETLFAALLFPDKTTAYGPYITSPGYEPFSILARVEATPGLLSARLGEAIPGVIQAGGVDAYLPDDEHCGSLGYAVAAESLVEILKHAGLFSGP